MSGRGVGRRPPTRPRGGPGGGSHHRSCACVRARACERAKGRDWRAGGGSVRPIPPPAASERPSRGYGARGAHREGSPIPTLRSFARCRGLPAAAVTTLPHRILARIDRCRGPRLFALARPSLPAFRSLADGGLPSRSRPTPTLARSAGARARARARAATDRLRRCPAAGTGRWLPPSSGSLRRSLRTHARTHARAHTHTHTHTSSAALRHRASDPPRSGPRGGAAGPTRKGGQPGCCRQRPAASDPEACDAPPPPREGGEGERFRERLRERERGRERGRERVR